MEASHASIPESKDSVAKMNRLILAAMGKDDNAAAAEVVNNLVGIGMYKQYRSRLSLSDDLKARMDEILAEAPGLQSMEGKPGPTLESQRDRTQKMIAEVKDIFKKTPLKENAKFDPLYL